ncbi:MULTISPECIES: phosphate regulon sensor histidine kinase PhoR [Rodentibacter]|uniref:phosphate regulon sensor histidine kinase PhoR n=1 Tax=Rodentibacter TaxID=1960084 RepID=UPI001CFC75FE|nr:phosphate regulon sensor histidine kinase PhoR [Rodentibacter sp. JRC1]GJI54956.1 phosphate regulon sensor histidine kinase PhoR [Rodentibacter sp. JRC1]
MTVLLSALLRFIFLLVFIAGISYLAGGTIALWVSVSAVLSCGILYQLVYLNRLIRWLNDQQNELYGSGIWGHIFDKILALRKASQKRKKELSASITRFNQMIDTIPNGVIILNEGRIEWFNSLACKHLNLNYHNDLNSILQNLIRQPDFQQFLQQRIDDQPLVLKLSLPNGDYFKRIIQISRQPFEQHSELLITQDITKKEQLDEAQIAFVANVSHELRTPLTVINGFTETLLETPDLSIEQHQQFLSLMQKEGQRMLSVLSDLLTLSRLERGQSTGGKYRRFNLSEMVKQVVESTENFSQGQHQFIVDITPDLYFYGLETELYSAFSNLTFNAVRYTPEQGSITIRLRILETDKIEFSVTDTGVGIAAEHIPRLTERFYRVDNGRSRQTGGTGLGLAITKFALAKYNAKLDISSEVGKGSCFKTILSVN